MADPKQTTYTQDSSLVRLYDPSVIDNSINGFNLLVCTSSSDVELVLVIPNLGYGLLATMCGRALDYSVSAALDGTVTSNPIVVDKGDGTVSLTTTGQEVFIPLDGQTVEMMCTHMRANSSCDSSASLVNDLVLPIPLKVRAMGSTAGIETVVGNDYVKAKSIQGALALWAKTVSTGASSTEGINILKEAAASVVLRTYSTILGADGDRTDKNQWTAQRDGDRIESFHIISQTDPDLFDELRQRKKGTIDMPFLKPFVGVVQDCSSSGKRLYYVSAMQDIVTGMTITGVDSPPLLSTIDGLKLIKHSDTQPESVTGTAVYDVYSFSDAVANTGIRAIELDAFRVDTVDVVFPPSVLTPIENSIQYEQAGSTEMQRAYALLTQRPPVFTAGEYVHSATGNFLPFNRSYYLPVALGEATPGAAGSCSYCGGTGYQSTTTCLTCLGTGKVECTSCGGVGFITTGSETLECSTCGTGDALGYMPCDSCGGTGQWVPLICTRCNGSGVSFRVPEFEGAVRRVVHQPDTIFEFTDTGTSFTVPADSIGFSPKGFSVFVGNRLLTHPHTTYGDTDYIAYTVSSNLSESTYTITITSSIAVPVTSSIRALRAEHVFANTTGVEIYALHPGTTGPGFVWAADVESLPTITRTSIPIIDVDQVATLMYKDPSEFKEYKTRAGTAEGFGTLAYCISSYLSLLSTYKDALEFIATVSLTDTATMKGMFVSNGNPWSSAWFSEYGALLEQTLIGDSTATSDQLPTSFSQPFSYQSRSSVTSFDDMDSSIAAADDTTARVINIAAENIYSHYVWPGSVLLKPPVTSFPAIAGVPISVPIGSGTMVTGTEIDNINIPGLATVTDDGYVPIAGMFSTAYTSSATSNLLKRLSPALTAVRDMVKDALVTVLANGTQVTINTPLPGFESPGALTSFDYTLSSVALEGLNTCVELTGDSGFTEHIGTIQSGGNAESLETSCSSIMSTLMGVNTILQGVETSLLVSDCGTYTSIAVLLDNSDAMLHFVHDDGTAEHHDRREKGLWFYNIRKSYLVLISAVNFARATVLRCLRDVTCIIRPLSQLPRVTETDVEKPVNLSLFTTLTGQPCYPVVNVPSGSTGITVTSGDGYKLNEISRMFESGQLYYDLKVTVPSSTTSFEAKDTYPLFLAGLGGGDVSYFQGPVLTEAAGDVESAFDRIQAYAGPDQMTLTGEPFTDSSVSRLSAAEKLTKLVEANYGTANLVDARTFTGKIDVGYIFPYLSTLATQCTVSFDFFIDFKTAEPKVLTESSLNGIGADMVPVLISSVTDGTSTRSTISDAVKKILGTLRAPIMIKDLYENKDTARLVIAILGFADGQMHNTYGESSLIKYTLGSIEDYASLRPSSPGALAGDICSGTWCTAAPAGTFGPNENLFLSQRRVNLVAQIIIRSLMNDKSLSTGIRVGEYLVQLVYSLSPPSVPAAFICRPFRCYGFGSLFGDASLLEGGDQDQRSVIISTSYSSTGFIGNVSFSSEKRGIRGTLPLGSDFDATETISLLGSSLANRNSVLMPRVTEAGEYTTKGVTGGLVAMYNRYATPHMSIDDTAIKEQAKTGWLQAQADITAYLKAAFLAGRTDPTSNLYSSISPATLTQNIWLIITKP